MELAKQNMQTQSSRKDLSRTHTSKNIKALLLMKAPRKTIHVSGKGNGNWPSKRMIPSILKTIKIDLSNTKKIKIKTSNIHQVKFSLLQKQEDHNPGQSTLLPIEKGSTHSYQK